MLTVTFTLGNGPDTNGNKKFLAARLLREIADAVENGETHDAVRDGERVLGSWSIT